MTDAASSAVSGVLSSNVGTVRFPGDRA